MKNITELGSEVANGSHFQGLITSCRDELERVFGPASIFCGDKSTTEWLIQFDDGTIATIYDWKEPIQPDGLQEIQWHIGGFSRDAVVLVHNAVNEFRKKCIDEIAKAFSL